MCGVWWCLQLTDFHPRCPGAHLPLPLHRLASRVVLCDQLLRPGKSAGQPFQLFRRRLNHFENA